MCMRARAPRPAWCLYLLPRRPASLRARGGGGSEGDGGDDVEWLGGALQAVGVDEALRVVGAVRAEGVWAHTK